MAPALKLSRVQRKGQVTIPLEFRERLGIQEGDFVAFTETEDGLLITTQKVLPSEKAERIAAQLGKIKEKIQRANLP